MKFTSVRTALVLVSVSAVVAVALGETFGAAPSIPEGAPPSLKSVAVPQPPEPELAVYVKNRAAAEQLGKALFWDMQVGSDGVTACATCHFHAGADSRSINQLNPAGDRRWYVGPNFHLSKQHFPLRRLSDENNRASSPTMDVDDVVSSQGVFNTDYMLVNPGQGDEQVKRPFDPIFSVGGVNVRRVEPRNTPTVINAVFNFRQFWDGRAQNEFNGVNNWGDRDPNARVGRAATATGPLEAVKVRLTNSSLASQAVAPIVSFDEMSSEGRTAADIGAKLNQKRGKKISLARPLGMQIVHPDDSVLGNLSRWPFPGLSADTYEELIRRAFHREWWDSRHVIRVADDGTVSLLENRRRPGADNEFSLMEYNFSLFFGLALQLYQATLVSDDTPYDRWVEGRGTISDEAIRGVQVFVGQNKVLPDGKTVLVNQGARCINCHSGAEFTDAAVARITNPDPTNGTVRRIREGQEIDRGFNNIGVRPTSEDRGVGGLDPFGNPLSATALCRSQTNPQPPCPPKGTLFIAADGAFKAPGLRNVELTAPYFHNGGHLTLKSVMEFYSRGGDLAPLLAMDGTTAIRPLGIPAESAPLHGFQPGLSPEEQAALVAFMQALTDERVRYRKAPFDHPQLFIPNGQLNDHVNVVEDKKRRGQALDRVHEIPAVGRRGGAPLPGFLEYR